MKRFLLLLLCIATLFEVKAQEKTISGNVTVQDAGTPLPSVSVLIKGTKYGSITDEKGAFKLKVPSKDATLIIRHVGYRDQEVVVGDQAFVSVSLLSASTVMSEIVVTGYGQQTRKTLTSAITSVSAKEIENIPSPSTDQLLQGRASGVQVNSNTGAPGGGVFVRIRGTSSINASSDPLYVVDGIPIQSNSLATLGLGGSVTSPIADINPADIQSIEILKDASATAIYGARAANGVVLITTKRGSNKKGKITAGMYYGQQEAIKKPDVVDGPTFERLMNESSTNNWIDQYGSITATNPQGVAFKLPYANPDNALNTDWGQPIFRTGALRNIDLSISGGSDKMHYLVSANNFLQEAMLKNSDFKRNTFRINLDFVPLDKLKIATNILYSRNNRTRGRSDDNISGALEGAFFFPTNLPYYQSNGSYTKFGTFESPLAAIEHSDISMMTNRLLGSVYGEYEILRGLKFKSSFSLDYSNVEESLYDDSFTNAGSTVNGSAQSIVGNNINWIQENTLTYQFKLSEHSFNVLLGTSAQESRTSSTTATGTQFPSDDFRKISAAAVQTASSTTTSYGIASLFSRVNYDYKNKYLATINVRRDGSSRFGQSNQWGTFPSAAVGWVLSEEKFLSNVEFLSSLKIRASYGITGNQSGINDFQSLGLWGGGTSTVNGSYGSIPGISPTQLANAELKWETTKQTDFGLDFSLFDHRLNITADYYNKNTEDLLLAVPVPRTTGFENLFQNYGKMQNRGFELAISGDVFRSKSGLNWTASFNIATNKNKLTKLAAPFFVYNRDIYNYQEGGEMFSFYLHEQTGLNPKTGAPIFTDVNGDGKFDPNVDRKIVGTANPKFFGGFTNTLNYKNFDLMFFFQYSSGNKQLNWNLFFLEHGGTRASQFSGSQLARWQRDGDVTRVPRLNAANYAADLRPSRFLEDGSYMRLKNLSLGYTLPASLLRKAGMSNARIYVSGQNVFTFTNYTGLDPELTGTASNALTQGIEFFSMPQSRTFMAGFNIGF
ncbi:MAG: TonB-dependent receptor [Chitinophagaceae bacterium]